MINFLMAAILVMIVGHAIKVLRWRLFITVYEQPRTDMLLKTLACGHLINAIVPVRLGDIFRAFVSGRKLNNGFPLSIATVLVDLYLDSMVVGIAFVCFSFTPFSNDVMTKLAIVYGILLVVLSLGTWFCFRYNRFVKRIIRAVSSVFNNEIELQLLHISWSVISSIKDIFHKLNKWKLVVYSIGMWLAYFCSYYLFAGAVSQTGIDISSVQVFSTIFSSNCGKLLLESDWSSLGWNSFPLLLLEFMIFPLIIVYILSIIVEKYENGKGIVDKHYQSALPQLNNNDRLSFLENYFSGDNSDILKQYLEINQDVGILSDCSAGSNATTILCIDGQDTFYRKYAIGQDAYRLGEQVEWLRKYENTLPVAKVSRVKQGDNYYSYDMPYNVQAVGFFQFIHTMPFEKSWNILEQVLLDIHTKLHQSAESEQTVDKALCTAYVEDKAGKNLEIIKNGKYLKTLYEYDTLWINGKEYHNLSYYEDMLSVERLTDCFEKEACTNIHGDLTIENIICTRDGDKASYYLIDSNCGNDYKTASMDYGKLLQSLHGGYEFLSSVSTVQVEENRISFLLSHSMVYQKLYERYKQYLQKQFTEDMIQRIYLHEIIHFLRLMPYKMKKDSLKAVVFYAGLIMIMNDILEK